MMIPYYEPFPKLIERLAAAPHIELLQRRFDFPLESAHDLTDTAQFVEEKFGFALPEQEWPLAFMPAEMDIAWISRPDAPLPPDCEQLTGCISLVNFTVSFDDWDYHLDRINPNHAPFAHCSYFETGGAEDFDYRTFLHFVRGQGQAPDVRLFDRPDVLPLTLSMGEYVQAALAWHGAYGWQLLYLPLDVFRALPWVTRQKAYQLAKVLPALFPDADWSVIDTRRAYFDTDPER
ncbi:hypothetical protein LJ737_07495 [Hymenobacter sp. 15J16-1T3B]|uniref:hypothetical protein n=1 Tax=Hymenobacter sp. 15J16-1T3B TaxID=2886941 RepID=UPI001D0F7876|nr:hypothetical protein [Hymenobacter sp. 15J16-1T3B]MCC3157077.1 hypothetical protein [Hymenobacter sp. 15J16-1T3B]